MDVSLYFLVAFIDKLIFVQWEGLYLSGGSVTYSDIYVVRMENEIGAPFNPKFYRRCPIYTFNRLKKNVEDVLFTRLYSYHQNINLVIEISPNKLHDTKLDRV